MGTARRIISLLLTAALVLGSAGIAYAGDDEHGRGRGKNQNMLMERFRDWQQGYWANESLARMVTKGIILGDAGGSISSGRNVTKAEAALMVSRLLGLDYSDLQVKVDENEMAFLVNGQRLKYEFEDAEDVPAWAQQAMAMALGKGFMVWSGRHLNPMAPLNRLEATIILVKAAGLDAEAQTRMGEPLPFKDVRAIPYWATGYVAVAVEHGLINGYENGTFHPFKPVTRAEWAALLDRLDRQQDQNDARQVKGTITAVNVGANPSIAMTTPVYPGGVTYAVDDTAVFYVNHHEATIADLHAGDQVLVQLSQDRKILMVTVISVTQEVSGTVTATVAPSATAAGSISLNQDDGTPATYPVPAAVIVRVGSQPGSFSDIQVGDRVQVRVDRGQATTINVRVEPYVLNGTVGAVVAGTSTSRPKVSITTASGQSATYEVADYASIVSQAGANLTLSDVKVGDQVVIRVERNLITQITVKSSNQTVTSGVISSVTPASATQAATVTIQAGGSSATYQVAANAVITYNGSSLNLTDLRVGDTVQLALVSGVVAAIQVTARVSQDQSGQVTSLAAPAAGLAGSITINRADNASATYAVSPTATVLLGSQTGSFADIRTGDRVTLKLSGQLVVQITVAVDTTSLQGTVSSAVYGGGTSPSIIGLRDSSGRNWTFALATNAVILSASGTSLTFNDLNQGDQVNALVQRNLITSITVTTPSTVKVTGMIAGLTPATGGQLAILTLLKSDNSLSVYAVQSGATITWSGVNLSFGDLRIGDQVELTLTAGQVSAIKVVSRPQNATVSKTGALSQLNPAGKSFVLTVAEQSGGVTQNVPYAVTWTDQTQVFISGIPVPVSTLANGQQVTVVGTLVTSGAATVVQAARIDILQAGQ